MVDSRGGKKAGYLIFVRVLLTADTWRQQTRELYGLNSEIRQFWNWIVRSHLGPHALRPIGDHPQISL
jgi:hypothetical protein